MTGLSRCGRQYRTFDAALMADQYKLGSDGRYWPAGYLDGDNGLPGDCRLIDGGWNDER